MSSYILMLVFPLWFIFILRHIRNRKSGKFRMDTGQKVLLSVIWCAMLFGFVATLYEDWQVSKEIEAKTPKTRRESAMKGNIRERLTRFIENLETIDFDPYATRDRVEAVYMILQKDSDAVHVVNERYKNENPFPFSAENVRSVAVVSNSIVLIPDATEEHWNANYIVKVNGQQIQKFMSFEVNEGYISALSTKEKP